MQKLLIFMGCLTFAIGLGATIDWLTEAGGLTTILDNPVRSLQSAVFIAALTSLNLILRWLRWGFLLRRFHIRMPTRETFQVFFATLPAALTPLYVGELLRGFIVSRRHRHAPQVIGWVWLVERCSDVAALLVLWGWAESRLGLTFLGCTLLLLAPALLAKGTLHAPGTESLHTAQLPASAIVAGTAAVSLLAWVIPVLGAQLGLRAFLYLDFSATCAAFVEGTLLGGVSGIPGGAGIAGTTMILRLQEAGTPLQGATAAVAILRAATNWYAIALGIVVAVLYRRALVQLATLPRGDQQHFDDLSASYSQGIPEHVRQRLLTRKIDAIVAQLPPPNPVTAPAGLDLGCGHGWYASCLAQRGYAMTGIDVSAGQIAQARTYCTASGTTVSLSVYDGQHLPFPDASFDFVYSINVLHHVVQPEARERLLFEVVRVLKPGGVFLLHEMNVENFLFRMYMSYVFPLLKRIDEGTELWLRPTRLPSVPGAKWTTDIAYFTFLPEFLPSFVQRLLQPLERRLEGSRLRRYSAHYMAALRRI